MSDAGTLGHALDRIAGTPRLLVALDLDGTLAPLRDDPMTARIPPEARAAIQALAALPDTEVAIVSGRSLRDLRVIAEHDDGSPVHLAASHGAESWRPGERAEPDAGPDPAAAAATDAARRAIADLTGPWIEPKRMGFALHTRTADAGPAAIARDRIDSLMADRAPAWRRRTGHDILEFAARPEGKDTALADLRRRTGATAVLYAGDDVTDEDALASLGAEDLGVRVGDGPTAASVTVPDPPAVARMLAGLARRRAERSAGPGNRLQR